LREWLQRNPWVYVLLFVAAVALVWRSTSGGGEPSNSDRVSSDAWFVDVVTGELFRAPRDQVPPIKSPGGNEAAWASVYGCGGCGSGQRFVGYMTKHTDELKASAEADPAVKASLYGEKRKGRLYSADGKAWVAADSPAEAGMIDAFRTRCPGGDLQRCP
jgi:hypothetical protein